MTTLPLKNTANSLGNLLFGLFTHIVQGVLTLAAGGFAWWFAAAALPAGYAGLAPIMGLVMALITARYFYGSGSVATAAGAGAVLAAGLQDEGDGFGSALDTMDSDDDGFMFNLESRLATGLDHSTLPGNIYNQDFGND